MRIYRERNYETMSRRAAMIIESVMIRQPECVLGLATGSTPIGIYQHLIAANHAGDICFAGVRTVNLDEYRGLDGTHEQSYRYFMNTQLFDHVDIDKANTYVPDGMAEDGERECREYDALVRHLGGTDLQLLGLGQNGHIGFNEPGEFVADTHIVQLTQNTIEANSRLFHDISEVPTSAITMGLRSIMTSRCVLLVANGSKKADALHRAIYGPITPEIPASILQLHPNVIVVADEEALPEA